MVYKVWFLVGFSAGDCDIEHIFIVSNDEQYIEDVIRGMGSDVVGFFKLGEGVGVSEGLERTPSPSPLSPLIFEVTS